MLGFTRPVAFVDARVVTPCGLAGSLRFASTILELGAPPRRGDVVVDLAGAFVLPGLINAHDHLELNHYGALKPRARYLHADDWIDDLRPRLHGDPTIRRRSGHALRERLFIGALKNLLAGATTVAHHNPRYRELGLGCPVRVLARYGWAHSFSMEGQPVGAKGEPGGPVAGRCRATPPDRPFLVHVGEGTDARARHEMSRFAQLGCLRPNSVVVHGVAHTEDTWRAAVAAGTSLVWCPASNVFLLGRTLPLGDLLQAVPGSADRVCLGSDSRLTGARDLLDELTHAHASAELPKGLLLAMVTRNAARILRLPAAGRLAPGVPADLIVVPASAGDDGDGGVPGEAERALLAAQRRDIRLVVIGGRPRIGEAAMQSVFDARRVGVGHITVDGAERLASARLVRRIAASPIGEPGLEARS